MSGKSGEAGGGIGRTPEPPPLWNVTLSLSLSTPPFFAMPLFVFLHLFILSGSPYLCLSFHLLSVSVRHAAHCPLPTLLSPLSTGVCWAGRAGGTRSCCASAAARSRCSGGCPAPGCRCPLTRGATRRSWLRWCVAASCRSRPVSCGWSVAVAEAAAAAARPEGPF